MARDNRPLSGAVTVASCAGGGGDTASVPVVSIAARQWAFSPDTITLQKGVAVDLELISTDVHHGFSLPDFDVRADIAPDHAARYPGQDGYLPFHCDFYCGSGHEGMNGQLIVK